MKIAEINMNSRGVTITAKVESKSEVRNVNTKFGQNTVADAVIEDDSGNIKLVLWGEEIDKIKVGDRVKIENGFVKEWNGELQLSVGKFGKMTVVV